jgi:hypothetical protein
MSTLVKVARYHLVQPFQYLALTWMVLAFSFAVNVIVFAITPAGRLTLAELDERLEDVLSARTIRELARLISDLPGPRFPGAVQPTARPATPPPARPEPPAETRWSLLQSLLAPAGR